MTPRRLRVGISTCPNDTFAFHALLAGAIDVDGVALEFTLGDVEELNEAAAAGTLDVAKVSFAAALGLGADWVVLPAGAALGFGVGPVVLGAAGRRTERPRVLCPGAHTTATLLWRLFHPEPADVEQVVFSAIMPALEEGRADLGVCIHEGRFTYADHGLELVEDLGATWERATGAPLPLGGIVARRELGAALHGALGRALRASIEWGRRHPDAALGSMRAHAQELADDVLWQHVELYVNDWTLDLGDGGRRALDALAARARDAGVVAGPLTVAG